jgi:hypothetical protein
MVGVGRAATTAEAEFASGALKLESKVPVKVVELAEGEVGAGARGLTAEGRLAGGRAAGEAEVAGQTFPLRLADGSCFVAGTPVLTPTGSKAIEELQVGDVVLSRSEHDPNGVVEAKMIEAKFVRTAAVMQFRVRGRVITTTVEHPFYVRERGWLPAKLLQESDQLLSHDGEWVIVEAVSDICAVTTVYNVRVAHYHTYFVGCQEWGFSVWAHNASCHLLDAINDILVKAGKQPLNQRQVDSLWGTLRRGVPEDDVAGLAKKLLGQGPDGSLRKLLGRKLTETEADTLAKAAAKETTQFDPAFRAAEKEAERLAAEQAAQQALAPSQKPAGYLHNPKQYLEDTFGGKDALGHTWPGPNIGGDLTHAHHIVMQEGLGGPGIQAVQDAQAILKKVGIDPFRGQENLVWAPNSGYLRTDKYAQQVLDRLNAAQQTKDGITKALRDIAEIVRNGGKL